MKKSLLLVAITMLLLPFSLKSQKMVVVEVFTNTSCGYCPPSNQQVDNLAAQNPDKMAVIKYHTSWPGPNDPFYVRNKTENASRTSLYNVNGVPHLRVNGQSFQSLNQNIINTMYNENAVFDIDVYKELNTTDKTFTVTTLVKANQAKSFIKPKLYVVAVENYIEFSYAPGGNGEKKFRDAMLKFMPGISGNKLPDEIEEGDYFIFQHVLDYTNTGTIDENEIDVRVFIQDETKNVYQGAIGEFTTPTSGGMLYANDAELLEIKAIPEVTCENSFAPVIVMRNNGNEPITSATIKYKFNDENEYEYNWTGNIDFLETIEINLPQIDMTLLSDDNEFEAEIKTVNGKEDDYSKNNDLDFEFISSSNSEGFIKIVIRTDNKPEETTWELKDMATGDILSEGGPYYTAGKIYTEQIALPFDPTCVKLTIRDAGGDGICCQNGSGFFGLEDNKGKTIMTGSTFEDEVSIQISANGFLAVENEDIITEEIVVYPNPTKGIVDIKVNATKSSDILVEVYSVTGVKVLSQYHNMYKGDNTFSLNMENLSNGMYIINIIQDDKTETRKISLNK